MTDHEFHELRDEVSELTRRLDEQAAVAQRTQTAVASLADSVGQLVTRQRSGDRSLHLNSFVAYLLFTVLLGGAFFALYRSRTGAMLRERDNAVSERDASRNRASELQQELAARDLSTSAAYDFFVLLRDNKRSEAIAKYSEIGRERLTPTERELFETRVDQARAEIVDAGYLTGIDAFRRNDFDTAVTELRRGLAYQKEGSRAAQMRYYLGVALQKTGEQEEAARQLELALAGRVDQAGVTDARFYLAAALEELGQLAEARAEYEKFASEFPKDPLAVAARRKAAQLSRSAAPKN